MEDEVKIITVTQCRDCEYDFDFRDLTFWKYEQGVLLCDDCYDERLRKDEEDTEGEGD